MKKLIFISILILCLSVVFYVQNDMRQKGLVEREILILKSDNISTWYLSRESRSKKHPCIHNWCFSGATPIWADGSPTPFLKYTCLKCWDVVAFFSEDNLEWEEQAQQEWENSVKITIKEPQE